MSTATEQAREAAGDVVLLSCEEGVAWLTLNRPRRRNAISLQMRARLRERLEALDEDPEIRVAVITGEGPAFCAGVDLKERGGAPAQVAALTARPVALPLERFGKPLLAAINGPAVGGGLELALAADLRIASTAATFALPEVKLGSLPGSGGTQRLIQAVASATACKAIFTGEPFDAQEALRCGLVSDVVEPGRLIATAREIAGRIAANSPLSLRAAKIALAAGRSEGAGLALERALWGLLSTTADREEGRAAFRERRAPRFTGS